MSTSRDNWWRDADGDEGMSRFGALQGAFLGIVLGCALWGLIVFVAVKLICR